MFDANTQYTCMIFIYKCVIFKIKHPAKNIPKYSFVFDDATLATDSVDN